MSVCGGDCTITCVCSFKKMIFNLEGKINVWLTHVSADTAGTMGYFRHQICYLWIRDWHWLSNKSQCDESVNRKLFYFCFSVCFFVDVILPFSSNLPCVSIFSQLSFCVHETAQYFSKRNKQQQQNTQQPRYKKRTNCPYLLLNSVHFPMSTLFPGTEYFARRWHHFRREVCTRSTVTNSSSSCWGIIDVISGNHMWRHMVGVVGHWPRRQ